MAVCNKWQAIELIKLDVLFGCVRISVDDVDQSNVFSGRVMLIKEIEDLGEIGTERIVAWLDSFGSTSEYDIIINIEEISEDDYDRELEEIKSPLALSVSDIDSLTDVVYQDYDRFLEYFTIENHPMKTKDDLERFLQYMTTDW